MHVAPSLSQYRMPARMTECSGPATAAESRASIAEEALVASYACATRCPVLTYACATRCPVLT
eukprot:2561406-Rhodomonas_salina.2